MLNKISKYFFKYLHIGSSTTIITTLVANKSTFRNIAKILYPYKSKEIETLSLRYDINKFMTNASYVYNYIINNFIININDAGIFPNTMENIAFLIKTNYQYYNFYYPDYDYLKNSIEISHKKNFEYIIQHKINVYSAGMILIDLVSKRLKHLNINLKIYEEFKTRLVLHDLSKFTANEFPQYAESFFSDKVKSSTTRSNFSIAWNHHKATNDHHPEYFYIDIATKQFADMNLLQCMEFLADITSFPNWNTWVPANINKFYFSSESAHQIIELLQVLFTSGAHTISYNANQCKIMFEENFINL